MLIAGAVSLKCILHDSVIHLVKCWCH